MTRLARFLAASFALFIAFAAAPALAQQGQSDPTMTFGSDDAEMNAAIAKARESLPKFWAAFEAQAAGTHDYALKVRISQGEDAEHFWCDGIERKDGRISATIANEPQHVKTVSLGQRIDVPDGDITDWMFFRNGKIVGGETLKVMLKRMTPEERAASGADQVEFEEP